ncbi:NUDIX domain-containing protein [Paenibacillus sp. J22TS3]|uniref:NUDIX domain-containing protein n=1 Tax=Paenibacillus sp. J22TS3 TaxID=2807192 RepID=UPI001B2D8BAF|nr:NUDIX domain-containing protein [Paenibacillus sp. J22TS3]GIP24673.1 ADP-ribose pyrophosphatase [Paenibacillus sp. J22TS3]
MKPIRNSARAVIVEQERVLLTKNQDHMGVYYLFPGGGQEKGEDLRAAVIRECLEEIGCRVEAGDLIAVREYIGRNHEFAKWDSDLHQVEFYFGCGIVGGDQPANGAIPDDTQIGVEWIDLDQLGDIRVYPRSLADQLKNRRTEPRYLGDTN